MNHPASLDLISGAGIFASSSEAGSVLARLPVSFPPQNREQAIFLGAALDATNSELRLTATNFQPATVRLRIIPAAFQLIQSIPSPISLTQGFVVVTLGFESGGSGELFELSSIAGPQTLTIESSNPAVAAFPDRTVTWNPGESIRTFRVPLLGRGIAVLTINLPRGFNEPSRRLELLLNVI